MRHTILKPIWKTRRIRCFARMVRAIRSKWYKVPEFMHLGYAWSGIGGVGSIVGLSRLSSAHDGDDPTVV